MKLYITGLILLFTFPYSNFLSGQTLIYKGYKGDDYIGDMVVKRVEQGDKVIYTSDAQLEVSFLFTWKMRFYYEAEFQNGDLTRSLVKLSRDGKLKTLVEGKRRGDIFYSSVDGELAEAKGPIDYCILNTYFEIPSGKTRLFSERWGKEIGIQDNKNGSFLLQPPNGSHNTLIYKNGICNEMQFNHTLANVRFILEK